MGHVVTVGTEFRLRVEFGIGGIVNGRDGIFIGSELQRLAIQLGRQNIRAIADATDARDVVTDLALDPLYSRFTHILAGRGRLPGHDSDRRMATHAEVVDLAVAQAAHETQCRPVHRIGPGIRVHRALPLVEDVLVTAAAQHGRLELPRCELLSVGARAGREKRAQARNRNAGIEVVGVVGSRDHAEARPPAPTGPGCEPRQQDSGERRSAPVFHDHHLPVMIQMTARSI